MPRAIALTHINITEAYTIGREVQKLEDTYFGEDAKKGEIFKDCQKQFGRVAGKVYVDKPQGRVTVGWVFSKRERYEDSGEMFTKETWVVLGEYRPAVPEGVVPTAL